MMTRMPPTSTPPDIVDAPALPGLTFRNARDGDWAAMADILNRNTAHDGLDEVQTPESMAVDHVHFEMFQLERDVLIAEIDGVPVAYGMGTITPRGSDLVLDLWGAVDPGYLRQGIGTALHRTTRARLADEAARNPMPGQRWLRSSAMEQEAGQNALLEAEGFTRIRFGFEMRRSLTGSLPEFELPEGLEMRPVTPDQHRAIVAADNEAFRDHWGHREKTEGDMIARFANEDTDTSLWCVAWDGDAVAGSVMNMVFRNENEQLGIRRGWLDHVSVRRAWRGRGLAKALCAASFRVLREQGLNEAWLGVDASNPTGALQLYEGLGFGVARRWYAFGRPVDQPAAEGWRPEGQDPN